MDGFGPLRTLRYPLHSGAEAEQEDPEITAEDSAPSRKRRLALQRQNTFAQQRFGHVLTPLYASSSAIAGTPREDADA